MPIIIDKIWGYLMAIVILIFVPVMIYAMKTDQMIENYANDVVNEFVDNACATGIISSTAYEKMVNNLDKTGIVYDIYLIHSSEQIEPKVDDDGNVVVNSFEQFHNEFRNEDIFELLFEKGNGNNKYYMKEGDFLRVIIESRTPSWGTRLWNSISHGHESHINVNAGNYVGNQVDSY